MMPRRLACACADRAAHVVAVLQRTAFVVRPHRILQQRHAHLARRPATAPASRAPRRPSSGAPSSAWRAGSPARGVRCSAPGRAVRRPSAASPAPRPRVRPRRRRTGCRRPAPARGAAAARPACAGSLARSRCRQNARRIARGRWPRPARCPSAAAPQWPQCRSTACSRLHKPAGSPRLLTSWSWSPASDSTLTAPAWAPARRTIGPRKRESSRPRSSSPARPAAISARMRALMHARHRLWAAAGSAVSGHLKLTCLGSVGAGCWLGRSTRLFDPFGRPRHRTSPAYLAAAYTRAANFNSTCLDPTADASSSDPPGARPYPKSASRPAQTD